MKRKWKQMILTVFLVFGLCSCGGRTDSENGLPTIELPFTELPTTELPFTEPQPPTESSVTEPQPDNGTEYDGTTQQEDEQEDINLDVLFMTAILDGVLSSEEIDKINHLLDANVLSEDEVVKMVQDIYAGVIDADWLREDEFSNQPRTVFWDYPELNNTERNMKIMNATSFCDGVAWVTVGKPYSFYDNHIMLIDTVGQVLYHCHNTTDSKSYTNFAQGVSALYINETQNILLINTLGKVVWDMQKDGVRAMEEIYGTGSVNEIWAGLESTGDEMRAGGINPESFNGCLNVWAYIDTFEKTGRVHAVVNPDGSWLIEPNDCQIHHKAGKCYYSYHAESGDSWGTPRGSRGYYVNYVTKDIMEVASVYWSDDIAESEYEEIAGWQREYERSMQDGLLYDREACGFTDAEGNVVIDCSNYELDIYKDPVFYNGYAALHIKSPGGGYYFVVLDRTGTPVFQPIKGKDIGNRCYVSDGYIASAYASKNYVTMDGEIITTEYAQVYPFSNGYSLVEKGGYDGSYYYLNTELQDAFPQEDKTAQEGTSVNKTYTAIKDFDIKGKWKNIGSYGFGQAQSGAIIAFDGTNCNFFSPSDTYALSANGSNYRLECTSYLSAVTLTFVVKTIDENHIDILINDKVVELQRMK